MKILFSKNTKPLSRLIMAVTHEPVSHCAVQVGEFIIHSTTFGPEIRTLQYFAERNTIVHEVTVPVDDAEAMKLITCTDSSFYDYPALLYLGIRYVVRLLGVSMPRANLWKLSGMYICTELVTKLLFGQADAMITPYQLYQKLRSAYA
jgi:hypothetical protein